jgi:RecB family exonuclease
LLAERSKIKIPKRFTDKYGDHVMLWSYSRINTLHNCTYEYYLSRIKHIRGKDNIYTLCGTYAHDIMEKYYNHKLRKNELAAQFETDFLDVEMSDYKFSSDEYKNEKMRNKYKNCVIDFFKHHKTMSDKVATEKILWIDINGNLFMGYVDAIHKDKDGNFIITDYKTSTMYKGKQVAEHGKQLLLYALGLIQGGIPINKIKCRWLFMKYVNISFEQKNGKIKTTIGDRHQWVKKIKTPLKRDLKELTDMNDIDIELKVEICVKKNSITDLPQEIQNKYSFEECYVYPEITDETLNELKEEMTKDIKDIQHRGKDEDHWERGEIEPQDSYYCSVLCGVHDECKYYQDYLIKNGLKKKEEYSLIKELDGLDNLPF